MKQETKQESDAPLYVAIFAIFVIMATTIHVVPNLPSVAAWFKGWLL